MSHTKIYHGDCLEVLPTLEENSVDTIIADYPFGFSDHDWDCTVNELDELIDRTFAFFKPILKSSGSAFVMFGFDTVANAALIADKHNYNLLNWIVWRFDVGYHPTTRFKSRSYHILWITDGDEWKFNGDSVRIPHRTNDKRNNPNGAIPSDVWTDIPDVKKNSREYAGHKGQKPINLIKRCVLATTDVGDTVLDPFMGSGTTGEVCIKTKRNFIGIELDSEFFKIARARIEEAKKQPALF